MSDELFKVAEMFMQKLAARTKMSRKQMEKDLFKSKNRHKQLKTTFDMLQKQNNKLQIDLEETAKNLNNERRTIKRYHEALEKMDFADSEEAVFYDDEDVAFVVDGREQHIHLEQDGTIALTPMRKHRRDKKQSLIDSGNDADDDLDFLNEDFGISEKVDEDDEDDYNYDDENYDDDDDEDEDR